MEDERVEKKINVGDLAEMEPITVAAINNKLEEGTSVKWTSQVLLPLLD